MAKSKGRLLAELLASDGKVKESKSALDISGGKLAPSDIPTLPISKLEHNSISIAGHNTSLGGSVSLNTGDITEHTQYKYYTDERVRSAISASGDLSYNSNTGVISFSASDSPVVSVNAKTGSVVLSTTDIAEGTNKYYTDARVSTRADTILNHSNHSNITVTKVGDQLRFSAAAQYGDSDVGSYLSTNGYATQSTIVGAITDSAPATLDTLNELAAALGDDANFSTTVTNSIATKLPKAGGTMTGRIIQSQHSTTLGNSSYVSEAAVTAQATNTTNAYPGYGFHKAGQLGLFLYATDRSTLRQRGDDGTDVAIWNTGDFSSTNVSNWNTAYGWGNHASAGYLTSFDITTQTDSKYLRSNAADTASERITFSKGINVGDLANGGITGSNYNITGVNTLVMNDPGEGIQFAGTSNVHMYAIDDANDSIINLQNASELRVNNNKVWTVSNDGSGSGLDADLLDGQQLSYVMNYDNLTNKPSNISNSDTVDGLHAASFLRSDATDTSSGKLSFGYLVSNLNNVSGSQGVTPFRASFQASNRPGTGNYFTGAEYTFHDSGARAQLGFGSSGNNTIPHLYARTEGWSGSNGWHSWYLFWHAGNDGSGSGLDADTLDGLDSTQFLRSDANDSYSGVLSLTGELTLSGNSTRIDGADGHPLVQVNSSRAYLGSTNRSKTVLASSDTIKHVRAGTEYAIWTAFNDGSGSGLDADLLDGQQPSQSGGANKIAQFASNGYLTVGNWIYSANGTGIYWPSGLHVYESSGNLHINTSGSKYTSVAQGTLWGSSNDGSGSGLDADLLDGWHRNNITNAEASQTWSSIAAASTQAKRYHIARLYGCPAHWDSNWQNIELHVTAESYEAGTLKYKIHGNYGGAGSQANMIQMHLTEAYGDMIPRFRIVLGTPTDAGWDHSGQDTYYVDVFAEAAHYSNWKIHAKTFGHGVLSSNPTSGGANTVFYSSPSASNISTFSETHTQSTIRLDTSNIQTQKAQTKLKAHSNGWDGGLALISQDGTDTFQIHPDNNGYMYVDKTWYFTSTPHVASIGSPLWHPGNDGSNSGLDADMLDGQHGSYYLAYGNLTGTPTIPSLSGYATESYVNTAVSNLVDSSPSALNTLNELAAALGDDANFSATVNTNIATKLPKAGGTVTGDLIVRNGNANAALHLRTGNDFVGIGFNRNVATGAIYDSNINAFQMHIQNNKLEFETYNGSGTTQKDGAWILDTAGNQSITGTMLVGGQYSNNSYSTVSSTRLLFGGGNDQNNYHIGTNMENYGGNYTKLDLRWHTGIRMGAQPSYGGIRFFNNEDLGSVLFSIGKGDTNMRVEGGNMLFTGDRLAIFGPNSGYSRELAIGGNGNLSTTTRASIGVTNGNLHIDSASGNATYLNFYDGTSGVAFGSGNSSTVAWMGPDGDLWKGSSDNSGSKYWHAGNDGSGSGLDADQLDGYHKSQITRYQSGNDFANGTLVTTNINSGNTNGDSFVIEISGKAYGSSRPHFVIAEGYLYNNSIISTNGSNIGGSNFTYLKVMNISGNLCFWWPRHGYWNSYDVYVRSSSSGTTNHNRVTSIANSTDPSSATKKIQINLVTSWTSSNDGSSSGLDADLLDGIQGSSFLRSDTDDTYSGNHLFFNGLSLNISNNNSHGNSAGTYFRGNSSHFVFGLNSGNTLYLNYGNGAGALRTEGTITHNSSLVGTKPWGNSNDGSGSGLDADLLDGQHGSYYYAASNPSGFLTNTSSEHISYVYRIHASDSTSPDSFGYDNRYQTFNYGVSSNVTGPLISFGGLGSGYPMQVTGAYGGGGSVFKVRTRNGDNGTWNSWRTLWHDGNDGSGSGLDADLLDGQHGSFYQNAGNLNAGTIPEARLPTISKYLRSDTTDVMAVSTTAEMLKFQNNTSGSHIQLGFQQNDHDGLHHRFYIKTYKGSGTASGNVDLIVRGSGGSTTSDVLKLYSGSSASWRNNTIWDAGNDGSGSGLDADLLDGQHASAFAPIGGSTGRFITGGLYGIGHGNSILPIWQYNAGNPGYGIGYEESSPDKLRMDVSSNLMSGTPDFELVPNELRINGNKVWNAGNDGSGSGLDADTVDGLQVHTARNNVADRIVRTNVHGYIDTGYINTINNDMTTTLATKVYVSNDNYIRHHDMNSFRSLMNVSANGEYNGREQSTTDTNYWIGSMGWGTTDLNNVLHYGSGFWDSWGTPGNRPSTYTSHWTGINMMHYSASGTYHHGGQMAMGAGNPAHTYLRGWWANGGSGYGWQKIWTDGNDGSGSGLDADTVDGKHKDLLMHYKGQVSGNWDTIFSQTDGHMGVYQVTNIAGGGHSNYPTGAYTYGGVMSWQLDDSTFKLYAPHVGQLFYQTGWNNDEYSGWRKIWDTGNDGSGSGLDADLLDGVQGSSFLRSDTNDSFTGQLTMSTQKALIASDYGHGVYGVYNSYRHQHVWSMGTSYNLGSNGQSVGNLYGLSYTHTNVGTGYGSNAAAGLGHQLNGRANGTLQWALGDGIWSSVTGNVWGAGNDGSGSGLDADTLDGNHASAFALYDHFRSLGTTAFTGGSNPYITNAQYISEMESDGAFDSYTSAFKTSWSYAGNYNISDAGTYGPTETAGMAHLCWTDNSSDSARGNITVLAIAPNTGASAGRTFIYNDQGSSYSPGWREIWTSRRMGSGTGLDADLLDGQQGSHYLNYNNLSNKPTIPTNNNQLTNGAGYITASGTANQSHMVSGSAFGTTNSPSSVLEYQQASGQTDTKLAPSGDWHNTIRLGHGNPYSYYSNTIALRMTGSGLGDLYTQTISNNNAQGWNKHWHANNDGSGSGLDADLLDGLHAKSASGATGASQVLRSHSNNYFYHQSWIDVGSSGLFSTSTNGAHFKPNATTSYGTWASSGSKGGYDGLVFDGGGDAAIMFDGSGNGGMYRQAGGGWYNYFHVGNNCMGINDSTTSSSYGAYLTGAFYATGNITAYSDKRVKENIVQIDDALEKVNKLEGVYYNRIDDESKTKEIGFIAQDVNEVVPELVTYAEDVDQYGVKYQNTTALLVEAVKELTQQVNDLKKELEEIKNDK